MRMEAVTAIKAFPYGKKFYKPGAPAEVEAGHVLILEKMGLIARKTQLVVKQPLPIQAREMEPESESEPTEKKKRKTYRRMDLRAEE